MPAYCESVSVMTGTTVMQISSKRERKLRLRLSQAREDQEQDQSDDPEEQMRRLAEPGREEEGEPRQRAMTIVRANPTFGGGETAGWPAGPRSAPGPRPTAASPSTRTI